MGNFYSDNDDLRFYMERALPWEEMVEVVERGYTAVDAPKNWQEGVETYKEVLELLGGFVANEVAPHAAAIDRTGAQMVDGKVQHPREFDEIFEKLAEMGVYGMTLPRELGGLNSPALLYFLTLELFSRGDASVMSHFGFHTGIATSLLQYSLREGSTEIDGDGRITKTRFGKEIAEIISGEAWGSMDLTEPGAGSDLAALRTRAVKGDDGQWRITGNKIFITSGHGKYHLVIAKTDDREDLDAISLFLVPTVLEKDGKTTVNAVVDRIEEKLGHHGSVTASIQYDDSLGELIGEVGEGFRQMLLLMNNARIAVGFQAIGACENVYRQAVAYADERRSMGKPIARHEMIANYLDEMDITIKGLRALAMESAVNEEMSLRLEYLQKVPGQAKKSSEVRRRIQKYRRRARQTTPLLKYAASEAAVWMARMNMQIHGGNGYMQDYAAERLLRDALVMPVYEGTSQIQSLMALKDHLLAAMRKPQDFLKKLAFAKLNAVRAPSDFERRYWAMKSLSYSAQQHILLRIAKDKWSSAIRGPLPRFLQTFLKDWDPKRDFSYGLLHAENLIKLLADVAIARALMEQAQKFPERRELAERWLDRAEPRVRYQWDLIVHTGDRVLERLKTLDAQDAAVPEEGRVAESAPKNDREEKAAESEAA